MPSVPSAVELGYMDAEVQGWFAVVAPAGTPAHAVVRLNQAINKTLAGEAVREPFIQLGYTVPPSANTPEALDIFLEDDTGRWTEILESRQIIGVQ